MSENINEQQETTGKNKVYPTSFRLSKEVLEKFKEVSHTLGVNQEQTMTALIQAYELQGNKVNLPEEMNKDIKKFEETQAILTRLYIGSLDNSTILSDTIKEQYRGELIVKDEEIAKQQKTIDDLISENQVLNSRLSDLSDLNNQAKNQIEQITNEFNTIKNDLNIRISDKEKVICTLEQEINSLKKRTENYESIKLENEDLRNELSENNQEIERLKKEIESLSLMNDKKLLEVKEEYNEKLLEVKEEYNKKFLELSHQVMDRIGKFEIESEKLNRLKQEQKQLEQKQTSTPKSGKRSK